VKRGAGVLLGGLGVVLAFGVLGPFGAIAVGWFLLSPDPAASTARGGGVGAIGAAASAATGYLADEWRAGGPARQRRRNARRDRWLAAGGWRARALDYEHGAVIAWRVIRSGVVAIVRGAAAIPAGVMAGAEAAREHRARRDTTPVTESEPDSVTAEAGDHTTADAGGEQVIHQDDLTYVLEAQGHTCPRCGTAWQPDVVTLSDGSQLARMRCPNCGAHRPAHDGEIPTDTPTTARPRGDGGPTDSGGHPATGQAPPPPTGEGMTQTDTTTHAGGAELTNTGDLRAEVIAMQTLIEEAEILGALLQTWQNGLSDAYESGNAAGGPKTRALDEAVAAVSEAGADGAAFGDALSEIRLACDQADALGEEAASMGADGHTKGFVPA
jgi:hypothetical protein